MSSEELNSTLEKLAKKVNALIEKNTCEGGFQPEEETYFRWKVERFQYTDKGVSDFGASGEYFAKKSWFRAIIKTGEQAKSTEEYSSALKYVNNAFGTSERFAHYLDSFVAAVAEQHLDDEVKKVSPDSLVKIFIKDLKEEPVKSEAEIELQGLVLRPEILEPIFGITIRKTKIEDLEKAVPAHGFMNRTFPPNPSAIMQIEILERNPAEIQKNVEKAITILRLFRIGSIKWTSYVISSESITGFIAGRLGSGSSELALETYIIEEQDLAKLKRFWKALNTAIPESFFWPGSMSNYLTIAYNRYSEALLKNGLFERRVANAVMGLEALILKPGEKQELTYRLGIRISKLLSQLGYSPHEARNVINDAYKVRNLFAHGGQLDYKGKKKLESKYHDIKNLLLPTLNYLRILLVVMILTKKGKDEFIDLIDDSLVDKEKETQLHGTLSEVREILKEG
jgi:hypothetical protein